jgi:hypothetical protein
VAEAAKRVLDEQERDEGAKRARMEGGVDVQDQIRTIQGKYKS